MTMATKGRIFFAARAPVCVLCFFMRAAAQAAAGNRGNSRKNEVALETPNTPPRAGSLLP